MKTKITATTTPNGLGIEGYDFGCRTHFSTLSLGARGIAVRLQAVRGRARYMVVTGTDNHQSAYEIARKVAPVLADD